MLALYLGSSASVPEGQMKVAGGKPAQGAPTGIRNLESRALKGRMNLQFMRPCRDARIGCTWIRWVRPRRASHRLPSRGPPGRDPVWMSSKKLEPGSPLAPRQRRIQKPFEQESASCRHLIASGRRRRIGGLSTIAPSYAKPLLPVHVVCPLVSCRPPAIFRPYDDGVVTCRRGYCDGR
jgi:hypothetical protein